MKYIIILIVLGALLLVGELFIPHDPEHLIFWFHKMPGFEIIFGFLGCIMLIVAAKRLGHYWLNRKEDYYND